MNIIVERLTQAAAAVNDLSEELGDLFVSDLGIKVRLSRAGKSIFSTVSWIEIEQARFNPLLLKIKDMQTKL